MSKRRRHKAAENAKNHPLIIRMREIRKENNCRPVDMARCMKEKGFPEQMVKHIEDGYQKPPFFVPGSGISLRKFMDAWYDCVHATPEQRDEIEDLVQQTIFQGL